MMFKKSLRQQRVKLHKVYLNLVSKTFDFIDKEYCGIKKNCFLTPKQNLKLYGSLVFECTLTDLKKKDNFLYKFFFNKIRQHPIYEKVFIAQELLQLVFLPCFFKMTYYTSLQHHILENGALLQIDLKKFFFFIRKELKEYIKNIEKIYKLKNLLNIQYLINNLVIINKETKEYVRNRKICTKSYQEIQAIKHKTLTILLLLLKALSKAKTKKEIKIFINNINIFLFKSDELFCGCV